MHVLMINTSPMKKVAQTEPWKKYQKALMLGISLMKYYGLERMLCTAVQPAGTAPSTSLVCLTMTR